MRNGALNILISTLMFVSVHLGVQHRDAGSRDVRQEAVPRVGGDVWLVPWLHLYHTHPWVHVVRHLQRGGHYNRGRQGMRASGS